MTENRALLVAGAAHLALFAGLSLSWRLMRQDMPPIVEPIPVEFVDIADLPTVTQKPKPSIAAAPRETVESTATPEAKPVPEETPPAEVAPKTVPPKPKRDLSNLIDKALKDAPRKTRPTDFAKSIEEAIPKGARLDARTSATLAQAIRERIYKCWDPNAGNADARTIKTLLRVRVLRSGAVIGLPQVVAQSGVTAANAAYARVASGAAIRAVMNPACSLAGLPPELYEGWKEFELNFDLGEM